MTVPVSPELRGRILALGAQKYSSSMISNELKKQNFTVTRRTVSNVLKNHNNCDGISAMNGSLAERKRLPNIRTPSVIKKVKNFIASDNPPTQREMARRVGVSQATINRIIHHDLNSRKKMKAKVHHLNEKMILQRKERALKFYNLIANGKYKNILTMDEAMLPFDFKNGQREFFYQSKNPEERRSEEPLVSRAPSFPEQRMFTAGYGWFGPTRHYVVPPKAKINAETFIEWILKPMMLEDVPRLYGANKDKVILHFDSARSHTAKLTYDWLDAHGINYITKDEWLTNSPELSPMDYFANGYFKSQLKKRKYRTMNGMLKAADEEWRKIPLEMFRNSLKSWPYLVMAVHKSKGKHIQKRKKRNNKK
jgi:hypothetical protein